MLGVLSAVTGSGPEFAPSVPAALLPVAGHTAVERAAEAMVSAGVDALVVPAAAPAVRERLLDRYPDRTALDAEPSDLLARHDQVLCMPATTVVAPGPLASLVRRRDAVLRRSTEPLAPIDGPEPRPVSLPASAFDGRRLADAAVVASERHADGLLDAVERDHVADVRRPWELLDAVEWLLGGTRRPAPDGGFDGIGRSLDGDVHPDAEIIGPVVVQEGATIRSGTVVEGPALVTSGATLGPNCYLRAHSFISAEVNIGAAVEIKNSVVCSGAKVPHLSYVGDSVVGPDANVGAGTIVANLRHDEQPVTLAHGDRRVQTGRRKFGVVIGEGAKLGIGTRVNVGTTVGPTATTAPGEVVLEDRRSDE